ncbi:MAG: metallopeptidase family protein [Gemmatimonadales bacterium]
MRLSDFRSLIHRLTAEVPGSFYQGVAEVVVSPRAVPHPTRADIYTMGECIPLPAGEAAGVEGVQSRIVLYYGSFAALAELQPGFDWRAEAWETLTHELRHHLEWRARAPNLEDFDWAVEQNFARQDGESFDPAFYLQGDLLGDDFYQVEDDLFLDLVVGALPARVSFVFQGRNFLAGVPAAATLPAFLTVEGLEEVAGELVLVLRRKPGVLDLFRPSQPFQAVVRAEERRDYLPGVPPKGSSE